MFTIAKYLSAILILLACNNVVATSNYSMPVGIPNTTLNFTQEIPPRPSNWNSEVEGYYYIDYALGSDSFLYGSESQPRKTLPGVLPPGSYVEIAGNYFYARGGSIKIHAEGSKKNWVAGQSGPVWITSSIHKKAFFTKSKVIVWGSNLYLTNINSKDGSKIQIGSLTSGYPATDIIVSNSEIVGTLTMGNGALLSALGAVDTPVKNIVFFNNILRDAGDINSETDIDAGLIVISGYSSYIWVLDNVGYNASGGALQINPRPPRDASHHIFAGNNEFYQTRQGGLWVKYATDVVFSQNYIHDIISTPWSPAKGIGGQYEPNGLWIINNLVHDVEYGIRIPSTNKIDDTTLKVYVIGNIIYNIHTQSIYDLDVGTNSAWESAAIHLHGADEKHVYNNLIFNAPNGINMSNNSGKTFIKNNIIHKLDNSHRGGASGYHIWSEQLTKSKDTLISNNYFSHDHMKVRLGSTIITNTIMLDSMQNAGAPHLVRNISGQLEITEGNIDTIIAQGFEDENKWDTGVDVYSLLNTNFSLSFPDTSIKFDYLKNIRNKGASIDIGPFEQAGTNPSLSIPNPPGNISVINN